MIRARPCLAFGNRVAACGVWRLSRKRNRVTRLDANGQLEDPTLQVRFERITKELRCLVCQNESIADSNVELASDLRRQVREMLVAGKSDDAIFKFMTDRYGEFVRFGPPLSAETLLIWGAPFIVLLLGVVIIYRVVRAIARACRWTNDYLPRRRSLHGCDCRGSGRRTAAARSSTAALSARSQRCLVIGAAAGLYPLWSNWNWHAPAAAPAAPEPDVLAMVAKLEQHMRDQPE